MSKTHLFRIDWRDNYNRECNTYIKARTRCRAIWIWRWVTRPFDRWYAEGGYWIGLGGRMFPNPRDGYKKKVLTK